MAIFILSALIGLLGSAMKPIPFVIVVAPALAIAALGTALAAGMSWLPALATFYASLALAELSYIGTVAARGWSERDSVIAQDAWRSSSRARNTNRSTP